MACPYSTPQPKNEFHTIKFEAAESLAKDLRREAGARGLSAETLAHHIAQAAVQDKIVAAILDGDD
jgi:hypothetical protein